MSQHINSMLGHLRMCSLMKSRSSNTNSTTHINTNNNTCNNDVREANGNIPELTKISKLPEKEVKILKADTMLPEKRHSISVHPPQNSQNGDVIRSKRDLSPSPNRQPRKSSHDIRALLGPNETVGKPIKVKNVSTKAETYDLLHCKGAEVMHCTKQVCMGSAMFPNVCGTEPRKPDVILNHAKDFLEQYYSSIKSHVLHRLKTATHESRWQQVQREVELTGTYQLTETELIYGAKLAWRNSARCIGRIQWSKLQVFDCRLVTTTSGMFEAICNHIKYATNKGNIRSAITVFPQRTDGKHDYRIWNSQLIAYAGFKNPDGTITGDPINVEFTEFCQKLGWKCDRKTFEILPMVLSANGHDPEYFELPPELVLEVPIGHPEHKWFEEMGYRWYAVPAVSGMMFDCGGIQFTGTAFSGWYMSTEIGCRDLCDPKRFNILEPVALKMGLDTRNPSSLWKDKALVEINIAVLHSFQSRNITIMDHHTASDSFMKHFETESRLRHGCPADWIWIVPPMSSSILPVFHQEMSTYYCKPSYEYQESPLKTHIWKKGRDSGKNTKPKRKFNFRQIARAVKFTSKLFGRALSRRIKATVLYATETGRSEQYAKQLVELLGHAFNAQIYCMADYDITQIEHEALLFVVASTFGNGDAPENGELFARDLYAMKMDQNSNGALPSATGNFMASKSFIKANSKSDIGKKLAKKNNLNRLDSSDTILEESFGPLSNVRFAVFALGSSAYPNFCSFGKYVDNMLGELGGERIMDITTGDEICGQEQEFRKWAPEVFTNACEAFCLDPEEFLRRGIISIGTDALTENTARFTLVNEYNHLKNLSLYHNKKISECVVKEKAINLLGDTNGSERSTILLKINAEGVAYIEGDHVGIFPTNRKEIVQGIIERLTGVEDPDAVLKLEVLKENHTSSAVYKTWEQHEKIPSASLRTLLSRYLDITTPPSRQFLTFLATYCSDKSDEEKLKKLADEHSAYEDWKYWKMPTILEALVEFPSCRIPATVFVAQLNPLQPRFYSISSSPKMYRDEIHITVAVVKYRAEDGEGAEHFGVCSNYLESINGNDNIYIFVRSASSFHIPLNADHPIILIGPGTGIAPFRSFWQYWDAIRGVSKIPKVWLFFGCRTRKMDLYHDEKEEMLKNGVLNRVFLALSREEDTPKTYVQDLALKEADSIFELIVNENGHVFVCGDVTMAEHVSQTLRKIIAQKKGMTDAEAEKFMLSLRDENRYHEDIFGITLRTAEIQNKSRASARIRMASQP